MNTFKGITGRVFAYSDEDHLLTAGDIMYQYDLDGFLTSKSQGSNITYYIYSSRGELLSVVFPEGRMIEYISDPLGRRIAKRVDGIIREKYLLQGLTRLLAVYDGNDNLVMRFEYADARMPVAMSKGGNTYYLTYDHIGSLKVIADAFGNAVKRVDYDSFGNIINDTNPTFTIPFGFAGGMHDRDTGFVRFGLRDYDPDTGTWTAKDPIGYVAGDVDLYSYAHNNPIKFIDPSGRRIEWGDQVLNNPLVRSNLKRLNQEIVNSGVPDDNFTLKVTGGDRYKDSCGNIRELADDKIVLGSDLNSPHLIERGARAVDLRVRGVGIQVFDDALRNTDFLPDMTDRNYPDGHTHIALPNSPKYKFVPSTEMLWEIIRLKQKGPCR